MGVSRRGPPREYVKQQPLMKFSKANHRILQWFLAVHLAIAWPALADVLVAVNGERFVGKVIEETADAVVFGSETGVRMTVPRSRIRELQKTPAPGGAGTNAAVAV